MRGSLVVGLSIELTDPPARQACPFLPFVWATTAGAANSRLVSKTKWLPGPPVQRDRLKWRRRACVSARAARGVALLAGAGTAGESPWTLLEIP